MHERGFQIEILDDGALRFVKPDGQGYDPPPPDLGDPGEFGEIRVAPGAAVTQWRGEKMDYGLAVQLLMYRARRCEDVSAETS